MGAALDGEATLLYMSFLALPCREGPQGHPVKHPLDEYFRGLHTANGRGRFGGQIAGGHPKAFPWPKKPLFAVPALRELESACTVSIL